MSITTRAGTPPPLWGAIGAAAAVSRLLNLDAERTAHALSIALTQVSGYVSQFGSGTKALHAGLGARDGLMAALLAKQGLTGQMTALDGPKGFATLMSHGDLGRLDAGLAALNGRALGGMGHRRQNPIPPAATPTA